MNNSFKVTKDFELIELYEINRETGLIFNIDNGEVICVVPEE